LEGKGVVFSKKTPFHRRPSPRTKLFVKLIFEKDMWITNKDAFHLGGGHTGLVPKGSNANLGEKMERRSPWGKRVL